MIVAISVSAILTLQKAAMCPKEADVHEHMHGISRGLLAQ